MAPRDPSDPATLPTLEAVERATGQRAEPHSTYLYIFVQIPVHIWADICTSLYRYLCIVAQISVQRCTNRAENQRVQSRRCGRPVSPLPDEPLDAGREHFYGRLGYECRPLLPRVGARRGSFAASPPAPLSGGVGVGGRQKGGRPPAAYPPIAVLRRGAFAFLFYYQRSACSLVVASAGPVSAMSRPRFHSLAGPDPSRMSLTLRPPVRASALDCALASASAQPQRVQRALARPACGPRVLVLPCSFARPRCGIRLSIGVVDADHPHTL